MPIKIGSVTLEHIIIDSVEMSKIDIGATTVFELVSNYTVNFIANGSIVSTKSVAAGGTTTLPSNPSRSNWNFVKWVYGVSNTQFTTSTVVNNNINVYAYWYQYAVIDQETCWKCSGSGYAYNDDVVCPNCLGLGYGYRCDNCGQWSADVDWLMNNEYCPSCGIGELQNATEEECNLCFGTGYLQEWGTCDVCNGSGVLDVYGNVYEAY